MSHTQEYQHTKEELKKEHTHEHSKESSFNATADKAEKKQKNWFQRWGNRFSKAFDYVHEKSVAFNEKGVGKDDIQKFADKAFEGAKKLEDGGFGDGTKIYNFFAERKWATKEGLREEMKKRGLHWKGERQNLGEKVNALPDSKNEAEVNDLLKYAVTIGQQFNVEGQGFVITSRYESAAARNKRNEAILAQKVREADHAHSPSIPKMNALKDFSGRAEQGHGGHDRGGRDHH